MLALSVVLAEQEGENLSGLSNNPDKAIFAVRENGTTCLMVEFAVKFLVPYDVLALNGIDVRNPPVHFNACGCLKKKKETHWLFQACRLHKILLCVDGLPLCVKVVAALKNVVIPAKYFAIYSN